MSLKAINNSPAPSLYESDKEIVLPLINLHTVIRSIAKGIGYKNDTGGCCNGIVSKGIEAALIRDEDSYNERAETIARLFIECYENFEEASTEDERIAQTAQEVSKVIETDLNLVNEVLPFFDGIELWQKPFWHRSLFERENRPVMQDDRNSMEFFLPIAASLQLEAEGQMAWITEYSGVYDKRELISYFERLKGVIDASSIDTPIAIKFHVLEHVIGVTYDPESENWLYIDSNVDLNQEFPITQAEDEENLALLIYSGLKTEETNSIIVVSSFWTLKRSADALKKELETWFATEDFKELHQVTCKKAFLTNSEGDSWLHIASIVGDCVTVESLLKEGVDVDLVDSMGSTALFTGAQHGHLKLTQKLLDRGAKVDFVNSQKCTALFIASLYGRTDIVLLLLSRGAKVDFSDEGYTSLFMAAYRGHLEIVQALIAKGAKLEPENPKVLTPLYMAAQSGCLHVVLLLLDAGASIDAKNDKGQTALWTAVEYGHLDVVRALLARGAQINLACNLGFTPLHMALVKNHPEILQLLLDAGAEVDSVTLKGVTPLGIAAKKNYKEMAAVLLAKKANPFFVHGDLQSPMNLSN